MKKLFQACKKNFFTGVMMTAFFNGAPSLSFPFSRVNKISHSQRRKYVFIAFT